MTLYTVQAGDTLFSIAQAHGLPMSRVQEDNGLTGQSLVPGQVLVLRRPVNLYTVQPGDTAYTVAARFDLSFRQLLRNNPALGGGSLIWPGQTLVLSYEGQEDRPTLEAAGYAYPSINPSLLRSVLPFLTYLTPFTYGFTPQGQLIPPDDQSLRAAAQQVGAGALLHLSSLDLEGSFSSEQASALLGDSELQGVLLDNILYTLQTKQYVGVDVDFEYLPTTDGPRYAAFIGRLREFLAPYGYLVVVALAPKTYAAQPGLLYEAHNYRALAAQAHRVFLMTYEWGYRYSEPMAVAPLPNVRRVVEYALTETTPEKIWLGIPLYGYDWPLPYRQGVTQATSLAPQAAVDLARRYGAAIQYDDNAQAPWFRYTDGDGTAHEVWFEDARSLLAKLDLAEEYGLAGVGFWNLDRPFPSAWPTLDSKFQIIAP